MGFLKDLGSAVGTVAGAVIGGTVYVAGELVDSDFIREVGEGAYKATANTGKIVGSVAEGTANVAIGIVTSDNKKVEEGFEEVVDTGAKTVVGIGKGIGYVAEKGLTTAGAILEGDTDKAMKTGKELAKVALVSTLAISVCDLADGVIDGDIFDADDADDYELVENPEMHHVTPHYRTLPDGSKIWVDGDGNTAIDNNVGWVQHNPDYRV